MGKGAYRGQGGGGSGSAGKECGKGGKSRGWEGRWEFEGVAGGGGRGEGMGEVPDLNSRFRAPLACARARVSYVPPPTRALPLLSTRALSSGHATGKRKAGGGGSKKQGPPSR